jgi:hypothetical protein
MKTHNKGNTADRYAPADFFVRQTDSAYHHGLTVEEMLNLLAKFEPGIYEVVETYSASDERTVT